MLPRWLFLQRKMEQIGIVQLASQVRTLVARNQIYGYFFCQSFYLRLASVAQSGASPISHFIKVSHSVITSQQFAFDFVVLSVTSQDGSG